MDFRLKRPGELRILPTRDAGVRALQAQAPRAEAFAEQAVEKLRPSLHWFYRARRRLATAAVVLLAGWIFVHVTFGANGMVVYRQKRTEYHALQKEISALQKENDRYHERIKALQTDPASIEKEAREQLHYARPGEVVYVDPNPPNPQAPASATAQK
jgi:cell division protein FtsB